MLTKRIIPCLDVKNGRVVTGINFVNLKDTGNPAEMALRYMEEQADELVFLDISASVERRCTMKSWVKEVADRIFIPFTVGGGISSAEQAREIIALGADKIALNTAAVKNPEIIEECAALLGRQAIVLAIDVKEVKPGRWEGYIEGGQTPTGIDALQWIRQGVDLGCGEILLTSMDRDGTKIGYDIPLLSQVATMVPVPIIASGGAGTKEHILEAFNVGCDGALAASIFHFGIVDIPDLKKWLKEQHIAIRYLEA
jgi:cyclase